MGYQLGVDLGTTYTAVAVLRDGRAEIATLGTRTLQVPSVAFLLDDGELLVGEPAERRSFTQSDRFAREFKRRIGDPTPIILGGTPFSAHALTARLLRSVVRMVTDREGGLPDHTVVTCPASWSAYKRDLLDQAIRQADIGPGSIATEPEAAAVHYASTTRVGPGEVVAVYDLGGGTFDAAVLRARDDGGFELLGMPQGLEQLGGVQFDDAVFAYATRLVQRELDQLDPDDPATLTALARLRRECVEAKEALSSDTEATILVTLPNWQTEIRLTRGEFESMIRPALSDTIETLVRTLRSADLQPEDVTAVLLVGGSSRIPLIAELVADELRRPTAVDIHPKHAVAMGAALLAGSPLAPMGPSPSTVPPPLPPGVPVPGFPTPGPPPPPPGPGIPPPPAPTVPPPPAEPVTPPPPEPPEPEAEEPWPPAPEPAVEEAEERAPAIEEPGPPEPEVEEPWPHEVEPGAPAPEPVAEEAEERAPAIEEPGPPEPEVEEPWPHEVEPEPWAPEPAAEEPGAPEPGRAVEESEAPGAAVEGVVPPGPVPAPEAPEAEAEPEVDEIDLRIHPDAVEVLLERDGEGPSEVTEAEAPPGQGVDAGPESETQAPEARELPDSESETLVDWEAPLLASAPTDAEAPSDAPGATAVPGEVDLDETPDLPGRERPAPVVPGPEEEGRRPSRLVVVGGAVAVVVLLGGLILLRGGGGGGDDGGTTSAGPTPPCAAAAPVEGGDELTDLSVFALGLPEHVDPARLATPQSLGLVNALYDGLTDVDFSDPDDPRILPQVAESYDTNGDATVWTFTIREGLRFSNGEPVLPSSFVRAWERATSPELAEGNADSYIFGLIEGGAEKLLGDADTIAGLEDDDEARTLRVELDAPYADFDAVVGSQPFMPMPEAVETAEGEWEDGAMVGNGPFMLSAPLSGEGADLVRNPEWNGTCYHGGLGLPEQPPLASVNLRVPADSDAAYEAFEAGDGQVARVPPGSLGDAADQHGNTIAGPLLSTHLLAVNWEDPVVGGSDNALLRQAISQAIDREAINEILYQGTATLSTGVTPPGVPGFVADLCDHCSFDREAARTAFEQWQADGNQLDGPIRIQSEVEPGTSDAVVAQIVDDLNAAGIQAEQEPLGAAYQEARLNGECQICSFNGFASFLTYDGFLYDLFHSESIGRFNFGRFSDETFDDMISDARATGDPDEQAELYRTAENRVVNDLVAAVPLVWSAQPYVHSDAIESLPVNGQGQIVWERVSLSG